MERKNDRLLPYNILAIQRFLQSVPGFQKAAESLLECAKNDEELKKILPKNLDVFGKESDNNFEKFASENPLVDFKRCFQQHVSPKQNGLSIRSKNPFSSQFISSKNSSNRFQRIGFLSKIRSQKHSKLPKNILWNDQLWNTFQNQAHILGHLDQVCIITFDQTGKRIISGSDESLIKIWSAVTGMLLMTLRGHEGEINDLQVHPDNTLLASCDDKKAIRIWCLRSGATVTCLMGQHTAHNITSISWGPGMICVEGTYIRPLVSTGNDGTVVFWSYDENEKSFILEAPPKFTERTKPGDRAVQQAWSKGGRFIAVGFSDGRIRVYMILKPGSPRGVDKIAELDVHTSDVSSIEFNQMQSTETPPALLSTSFDGFAIIWRMKNRRWKVQKIDCVRETDPNSDLKKRPKVNDGIWLKNDELICVAVVGGAAHQNIIKIFNSATSDLVTCLSFHTQMIQNLKAHPKIPHVFASSGCDGLIVIWDVSRSKKLAEVYFPSTIESGEQMSIHDIRWSSDGTKIISADSQGHMSISGFGEDAKLSQLPDELFFETDYHPLIRDREGFVVDEQTGLTPHLQNPGMFTNSQNEPYLGRVNDDRTRRQMAEEGQRDVLGDRIRQLDLEMTAAEIDQAAEGGTPMNVDENSVHLDMSVLTFDVQRRSQSSIKKPSWCNKDFCEVQPLKQIQKRDYLQKKLSKAEERWFKKEGLDCDVMEIEEIHVTEEAVPLVNSSQRRANRRRQRATDVEEPELPPESDEDHSIQGSDEEFNLNSSAEQREQSRVNRRRAPRGYVPVDDEPAEDDSDAEEGGSSSEESTTQENSSSEYVPTLEEPSTENNTGTARSRRARASREPQVPSASTSRQRRKKRIVHDESEDENEQNETNLDSSLEENQQPGPSYRLTVPPSRKKIVFSDSEDSDASTKKSDASSIDPLVQMSNFKKRNRRKDSRNKRLSEDSSSSNEPSNRYHSLIESPGRGHLQWIRQTQPLRCPFIPQIGDEVYYIPSAHHQFVKELENQKLASLRKFHRVPTQFKNSSLMDMDILCVVEELEIELMNEKKFDPPARWCSITLKCIHDDIDLKKFTIKYAPLENCEEFIIHKKLYDRSHDSEFKEGEEVWGIFEEIGPETRIPQWFAGIIQNVDPLCDETLYNKYTVKWLSDEKVDQQSGWNLVRRDNDEQPEIILSETEITDETRKRMIENLRIVIASDIMEVKAYFYEVEEEYRDEYEKMIPYPTNLTKIKDRLETNFYRNKSGLLWEIALLHDNCALFNGSNDSDSNGMFSMSKTLSDTFAEAVNNPKRIGKDFLHVLQTRIEQTEQEIVEDEENQASSDDEPQAEETDESESEIKPKSVLTNRAENQRSRITRGGVTLSEESSESFTSVRRTRFQSEEPLPESELEEYISAVSQSERFKQRLLKELRNLPARVQKEKLRDIKPGIFETGSKKNRTRKKRHRLSSSEEEDDNEEDEEDSDFEKENRGRRPAKRARPTRRKISESEEEEEEENELDESSEVKEDAKSSDEDQESEEPSDQEQESEDDDDEIPLPSYNKKRRARKISENFSDEARDGYGEQNIRRSVRRRSSRYSENSSSNSRPSRQSTRKKKTLYNFEDTDEDFSS